IYRTEKTMKPLLEMFPCLQTKETLASAEELASFKGIHIWRTCKDNHKRYLIGPGFNPCSRLLLVHKCMSPLHQNN
ncbi:hypothetical protein Taro_036899, partial [Colocasia esculenta]|nr:hypothetical protein [Colocasia esculenta]